MPSTTDIANRALQKLGAKRITSLSEDSKNGRAMNVAFEPCKLRLLREHVWKFSISRAELAADATEPDWGRANSFTLPVDFVRMADDYPEDNTAALDYEIEGRKILSDFDAPLYIRYCKDVTDPNEMDSIFRELLATDLALETCEEITQSNTKKDGLMKDREMVLRQARRAQAIESISAEPPEDSFITCRS